MAEDLQRNKGRPSNYKLDRGGAAADSGPFIGVVKNNVDPTKTGRLQVAIQELSGGSDGSDSSNWRTVSYLPPFYGITEHSGTSEGAGDYVGNRHSYGMWFTPPDLGTRVLCFFASGDPSQGYYVGCIPEPGLTHMVPAIGASKTTEKDNATQTKLFGGATRLPVTELNNKNDEIREDPRFIDKPKPVHSYTAAVMFQQGLINDPVRGPIGSSSQRESPSAVFGFSTPGRAIYSGGLSEKDIKQKLEKDSVKPTDAKVIGRRGGHTFVMDDGDIEGNDALVRIRSARGHQILMSDDSDSLYIIAANGQSWIELGKEGTVDIYSSNSINLRSQGELNFHADKSINMYAGEAVNLYAKKNLQLESNAAAAIITQGNMTFHSKATVGILANGSLAVKTDGSANWSSGGTMSMSGSRINLNSGGAASVAAPQKLKMAKLADAEFTADQGWVSTPAKLETIVSRAPTHEPYDQHSKGVAVTVPLATASAVATPPAPPAPPSTTEAAAAAANEALPENAMSVSDFVSTEKVTQAIGSITPDAVTGMLTQKAKDVGQEISSFTLDKGLGKFGVSFTQLESLEYLKPGIADRIATLSVDDAKAVLASPSAWTLKDGIGQVSQFLDSEQLQTKVMAGVTDLAFKELEKTGVLNQVEQVKDIAGMVSAAVENGPAAVVDWANGKISEVTDQINGAVKQAQYAVDFVTKKLPETLASVQSKVGQIATATRTGLDKTISGIIGNAKVPDIVYQVPKIESISDIKSLVGAATSAVKDLQNQVNNAVGQVQGVVSDVQSQVQGVVSDVQGQATSLAENAVNDLKNKLG